ncbi:SDR family oxidoreductase [Corynebacterium lizhenjunii]|uniref:SDR family oxidoreductase n=1 Tax=Corynebacterium lizhenjunii TaxID=2709394 RepID=A0A7T0KHD9_9CORY|nr:NAD(P)-binding oxidoreductase [Corynebacterium lizhenjunii]QPK80214.1 SDR family oxidoreductase [Corynebacterium lizhenjunii]
MTLSQKILYIGGHGKIALLAIPKLVSAGHTVTALVRNPEYKAELTQLGATPLVADITEQSVDDWANIFREFDTVVWGAGNGGRGGKELTFAVDRDGALATVDAAEQLLQDGAAPRYVMISYLGSTHNEPSGEGNSWDAYVEAKKTVDERIYASGLDYLVLAPSLLTDEPAGGVDAIADTHSPEGTSTSRELVAEVLTELVGRESFPQSPVAFIDGTGSPADL